MRTPIGGCILGLLLTLSCGNVRLEAQPVPKDSASQRILPLPEGRLSDVQTQMQLLQRLRSLIASADDTAKSELPSSTDASGIDDKQLEQLQQALKKLQEQLPPGIKPPDLDSIPKEQLDEAMSNPAMQQQLKKMLEQFSKDGLLPENDGDPLKSPFPPIPRGPGQPQAQPLKPQSGQESPPTPPRDQSWESLRNAMKKLSEIAQGGNNKSPQNADVTPHVDAPGNRDETSPRTPQKRSAGDERQPRVDRSDPDRRDPDPNDSDLGVPDYNDGEPGDDASGNRNVQQPSLQAFQDLLQRYKDSQRDQSPTSDATNSPEPDETQLPEVRPGMRSPRTENAGSGSAPDPSRRVIRRPDRAPHIEPPINAGPRTSERGEVFPPAEMPSANNPAAPVRNGDGRDQRTEQQSRNSSGSRTSESSIPSVSEFLKEQLRKGFPAPGTKEDVANSKSPGLKNRPGSSPSLDPGDRNSAQRGTPDAATRRDAGAQTEQAGVDIRRELQKSGVRGTLDKIIEKAKEESRAQRKAKQQAEQELVAGQSGTKAGQPESTGSQDAQTKSPGERGLQKSLTDLLGGMDDKMKEIIKDAKFKDQTTGSRQPRNSTWQPAPDDADSHIRKWNDAASDFLSDLSKAPSGPASPQSSSAGGGSVSADTPLAIGSFFLVGVGLLGILAVVAFLMRRPLLKLVSDTTGIAVPGRIHQQSEIRSREDVITAFHELALHPNQLVESWWTHRAAATKLAAESPQLGNAVQTLAEIYEQARYLPDDVELPADKIQSARTAFAECR